MHQTTLASVESDLGALPDHAADALSPDSAVEATPENAALSDRPYHSKRPHKKSRAGWKSGLVSVVDSDGGHDDRAL